MKKIVSSVFAFMVLSAFCSFASGKEDTVEVRNYNTIRIAGNMEESNDTDPEENKRILPYILVEDQLDLLAGGTVIHIQDQLFEDPTGVIENLRNRSFSPTLFVYYSNDTKSADTICIYEEEKLIYYSRTAYHFSPFQTMDSISKESEPKDLFDMENISLWYRIFPFNKIDENSAEYIAVCSLRNTQPGAKDGVFNDAEVRFNGKKLDRLHDDFYRLDEDDVIILKSGDKIIVSIKHDLIGEINKELLVPPSMDNLSVEPALEPGVPNSTDKYLLRWDEQKCDQYDVTVYRADENGELDSYGMNVEGTFHQWESWELQEEGEIVPYLEFYIQGLNIFKPEGFAEWSSITVSSPSGASHGNYQSENR